ncbi:MAG: hypothetical protein WCA20_16670 [Candidatus Sulfotelmatobacter sp.]
MNSARPAQDGNFCLGVWTRTGKLKYYLNHIPWQALRLVESVLAASGALRKAGGYS